MVVQVFTFLQELVLVVLVEEVPQVILVLGTMELNRPVVEEQVEVMEVMVVPVLSLSVIKSVQQTQVMQEQQVVI